MIQIFKLKMINKQSEESAPHPIKAKPRIVAKVLIVATDKFLLITVEDFLPTISNQT